MIYLLIGLAAVWAGAAILSAAWMWRDAHPRRRIPRCACGRVPLPNGRGWLDHPAVRHGYDLCSPSRECIK